MRIQYLVASALVALTVSAESIQAVPIADGWLAFQGCWRADEAPAGNVLCIVADGEGARLIELADGKVTRETRMTADGRSHPVAQEGCTGFESARWSEDGRRLYLRTDLKCGEGIGRNSSGLFALVSAREWVSINAITVDDEAATRTVRYQLVEAPTNVPETILGALRANRLARETARLTGFAPLSKANLIEAASQVHPRAVEALLFEREQVYDFNGQQLLALANAGLPDYLIDALVAVSHPERFAVRNTDGVEVDEVEVPGSRRRGYGSAYCDDLGWYDRYCSRYGYGYSPFGFYSPYGYGYGYRSPPVVVIVNPGDDSEIARHGTVTRRGYTNGSSSGRSSSGSSVSGSRTSSGDSSAGSSSSSSSSGSSSSSRGKAKPKGSGGN